jgi:hypothetical protein
MTQSFVGMCLFGLIMGMLAGSVTAVFANIGSKEHLDFIKTFLISLTGFSAAAVIGTAAYSEDIDKVKKPQIKQCYE